MRKFFILFLIFQSYLLYGEEYLENVNLIFDRANKLYEEGNYLEANNLYKELASSNVISKSLYYNLASSYLQIGSEGYAILWFERALNISPFDKDIKENISLLSEKEDKSLIIVVFYITVILFIIFFTSLTLLFAFKRKIYYSLLIFSVIFAVPSITTYNLINADYLIIISDAVLYEGNSPRANIIDYISEGKKLRILEEYENWYYVKGDFKGWVRKESAEKI